MQTGAFISIANKLFPGKDLWELTAEERSEVVEIFEDYH